jgi:hypothetical protein
MTQQSFTKKLRKLSKDGLNLGWCHMDIIFDTNIKLEDKSPCIGSTDFTDYIITIDSSLSEQSMKETFWHEISHCLTENCGLAGESITLTEEQIVVLMSRTVLLLFNLNPWLKELI